MLKCPICHNALYKNTNQLQCSKKHSFDVSKEGYVNLLRSASSRTHGDEKSMLLSRRSFLDKGYYEPLAEEITNLINLYQPKNVLDMGCGEGYYTEYFRTHTSANVIGMDISKEGVLLTQKRNKKALNIVASSKELPFIDESVEGIVSIFAPYYTEELTRVLTQNGIFIKVYPLPHHLEEFKSVIYDEVLLNPEEPMINEMMCINYKEVTYTISLEDQETIQELFQMTPYYHRTKVEDKQKLAQSSYLETTLSFGIAIYIRKPQSPLTFYELGSVPDERLQYAIILTKYNDQCVLVKHRKRSTLEVPGGTREDETIDACAKRELFEETGALKFELEPLFIFEANGLYAQVYYADIKTLGPLPESEIESIVLVDSLETVDWTYAQIQPYLFHYYNKEIKK